MSSPARFPRGLHPVGRSVGSQHLLEPCRQLSLQVDGIVLAHVHGLHLDVQLLPCALTGNVVLRQSLLHLFFQPTIL